MMPETTPERRARWPGIDAEAIAFLEKNGFVLRGDWQWVAPKLWEELSEREQDAIIYLVEEWDFGGIVDG